MEQRIKDVRRGEVDESMWCEIVKPLLKRTQGQGFTRCRNVSRNSIK